MLVTAKALLRGKNTIFLRLLPSILNTLTVVCPSKYRSIFYRVMQIVVLSLRLVTPISILFLIVLALIMLIYDASIILTSIQNSTVLKVLVLWAISEVLIYF